MQKFKVNGQSVLKIEWKQMDRRTVVIALPRMVMRLVIIILETLSNFLHDTGHVILILGGYVLVM